MKLSMVLSYAGGFKDAAKLVVELEQAGLDVVWVPEAYSFDAISQVGYLAAITERLEIGTAIVNVYTRTAALMAMTAAGCDHVSDGRFILGLGASGPQVIEGFHGMAFDKPMVRVREYIEACRMIWAREVPFDYHGQTVQAPLPAGQGSGLGKPLKLINHPLRPNIPIWWASLGGKSVEATAELADGWMPAFFVPEKFRTVWGRDLDAGSAKRSAALAPLQISAGGMLAVGEHLVGEERLKMLDRARPGLALYIGGMGARGKNFYNDLACAYGYEKEAAVVQDLYLAGKKAEAAAALPVELVDATNFVGPPGHVRERFAAFREAGVTCVSVAPQGNDQAARVAQVALARELLDG